MSDSNRGAGSPALAEQRNDADARDQGTERGDISDGDNVGNVPLMGEQSVSPNLPVEGQTEAQSEQPGPYGSRELIAQEMMAEASFWMAFAALGTLLVTAVGTFFLAWQVRLTREAVKDTCDATNAMVRQNELTETAMRPWLAITVEQVEIQLERIPDQDVESVAVFYRTKVKNIGQTAAKNVSVRYCVIDLRQTSQDKETSLIEEWEREHRDKSERILIPGGELTDTPWSYRALDLWEIEEDTPLFGDLIYPAILVYVMYRDSGGTPCHTKQMSIICLDQGGMRPAGARPEEIFIPLEHLPLCTTKNLVLHTTRDDAA